MASGIELMLKSFGIDVEVVKESVTKFQADLAATLKHFDARLAAIETRLESVEAALTGLSATVASCPPEDPNVFSAGKSTEAPISLHEIRRAMED
jgi:hypothetical protein